MVNNPSPYHNLVDFICKWCKQNGQSHHQSTNDPSQTGWLTPEIFKWVCLVRFECLCQPAESHQERSEAVTDGETDHTNPGWWEIPIMINQWDSLQNTGGHDIVWPEDSENVDVEDAVAELDPRGEDLDEDSTGRDDPAPAALQWWEKGQNKAKSSLKRFERETRDAAPYRKNKLFFMLWNKWCFTRDWECDSFPQSWNDCVISLTSG